MKSEESFNHLVRLLFSCLVDADFLDTERFINPRVLLKEAEDDLSSEYFAARGARSGAL